MSYSIPEMQFLKEKYPQYKDVPDSILLKWTANKYLALDNRLEVKMQANI